jgi:hypothetical protein
MTLVHSSPDERIQRLTRLGLDEERLVAAVTLACRDAETGSKSDPPMLRGIIRWAHTVRYLRERLGELGWSGNDDGNFSTVGSPDGRIVIGVATGDEGSGLPREAAATRYPRGPFSIFATPSPSRTEFWLLLLSASATEASFELSLPSGVAPSGRIGSWAERICFDPIVLDGPEIPASPPPENAFRPVVRRRQGK